MQAFGEMLDDARKALAKKEPPPLPQWIAEQLHELEEDEEPKMEENLMARSCRKSSHELRPNCCRRSSAWTP